MSKQISHLIHEGFTIPWTKSHISVVYGYLLQLGFNSSDFAAVSYVRHHCPCNDANFAERIGSLTQEIQELLTVPKFQRLHLKKNEILAAFVSFLLQLLHHEIDVSHSFGDRIEVLMKELRFLVTVLGEKVMQSVEIEQVQKLLEEFEAVANEAGRLVCSFIFSTDGVLIASEMEEALVAVFKHIELLKDSISSTFLVVLPNICEITNISGNTADVDSVFIVDSLINDLEDLMNREYDWFVDVKGHIKMLHRELIHSLLLLNDITGPQGSDIEKLNELVMQFRGEAFAADYVINSFLVGDAPLWYLTIRLTDVIHQIRRTGTGLEEIRASEVAKDFSAQLSLQANRYSEVDGITVGFEDSVIYILDQLVGGTKHLQIVTIFGMAGIGKTTLARQLYNDPSVNNYYFDKCSWCVVSQTYHRKSLLIDIMISLGSVLDKVRMLKMEEESLLESIYKCLKGRRYLIVMDDIWDPNVWIGLQRCFPDDRNGSRILFTTRNKDVSPCNSIIYSVPSLSNDQCWELLEKKVFNDKPCPPQLVGIG